MAQPTSTLQGEIIVPEHDMELFSDNERRSDMQDVTDIDIDIDIDFTADQPEEQDHDYILEDVRSDADIRSPWPVDQTDDDLMQDEERDVQAMEEDGQVQDEPFEDALELDEPSDAAQHLPTTTALAKDNAGSAHYLNLQPTDEANNPDIEVHTMGEEFESYQTEETLGQDTKHDIEIDLLRQENSRTEDDFGQSTVYPAAGSELLDSAAPASPGFTGKDLDVGSPNSSNTVTGLDQDAASDLDEHTSRLHPIKVYYEDTEMSLFPPSSEDAQETYFLQDESLATSSISDLFSAMRSVLADTVGNDDELELGIDVLGLSLGEDSICAQSTTLSQLVGLYLRLARQDGVENPDPLYLTVITRVGCARKLKELTAAAEAGKGISQLTLWDVDDHDAAGDEVIVAEEEETATERAEEDNHTLAEQRTGSNSENNEVVELRYGNPSASASNSSTKHKGDNALPISTDRAPHRLNTEPCSRRPSPLPDLDPDASSKTELSKDAAQSNLTNHTEHGSLDVDEEHREREDAAEDLIDYEEDENEIADQSGTPLSIHSGGDNDALEDGIIQPFIDQCLQPYPCFCASCDDIAVTERPKSPQSVSGQRSPIASVKETPGTEVPIDYAENNSTQVEVLAQEQIEEGFEVESYYDGSRAGEVTHDESLKYEGQGQASVSLSENPLDAVSSSSLKSKVPLGSKDGEDAAHSTSNGTEKPRASVGNGQYPRDDEVRFDDAEFLEPYTIADQGEDFVVDTEAGGEYDFLDVESMNGDDVAADLVAQHHLQGGERSRATNEPQILNQARFGNGSPIHSRPSSSKRSRSEDNENQSHQSNGQELKRLRSQ